MTGNRGDNVAGDDTLAGLTRRLLFTWGLEDSCVMKLFAIHRAILAMGVFCMTACATGGNTVTLHSIEFDAQRDSPDIEVLDYQYGELEKVFFLPERERIKLGQTFKSGNRTGFLPRGEFLYVKWRIKESGEILEERVDLRHRLPENLTDLQIHFVCHGQKLYVFVIWPWDGQPWTKGQPQDRYKPVPGGERRFDGQKIQQIYPDPAQQ